jgi:3-oxoacyl-(acyl-carrier-protein) synthase
MGAARVSIALGTRGPLLSQCTACAASQMAIGDGRTRSGSAAPT